MDEQAAKLILLNAPGFSAANYLSLLEQLGTATAIVQAGIQVWREAGLTPRCCDYLCQANTAQVTHAQRWLPNWLWWAHAIPVPMVGRLLKPLPDI